MMSDRPFLDQAAHVSAGAAFLLPAALWPNPATFALAGAGIGAVREITEVSPLVSVESIREGLSDRASQIDVAFWAVGGFLAGLGAIA